MDFGLVTLLRFCWFAVALPIIVASLPIPGAGILHPVLMGFAARGKTMPSSSRAKFTVPQRYFLHFYVVAVALTTCLLLSTWFYAYRKMGPLATESFHYSTVASHLTGGSHVFSFNKRQSTHVEHKYQIWRTVFVLLLMEAQVPRRLHETINVLSYSPSARMHIFGYLAGLFFYIAAPLSLGSQYASEAMRYLGGQMAEFIVRGRAQMPALEVNWWEFLKPLLKLGWSQRIGAAIFLWGWLHQLRCHAILVLYAGILVSSGGFDLTIWLLFIFVVTNLAFAAAETHRWYHHKFENYPPHRRAIIPLIY